MEMLEEDYDFLIKEDSMGGGATLSGVHLKCNLDLAGPSSQEG